MKKFSTRLAIAGLLATTLLFSGCKESKSSTEFKSADLRKWKTDTVSVQFRRDALGSAHQLPVSPTTSSINGATVSMKGRLIDVGPEAIVLESRGNNHWIPREVILLVKFEGAN